MPVGAHEIAFRLRDNGRVSVMTVCRVLDILIDVGLVQRVSALNNYLVCRRDHPADGLTVFLICSTRGSVHERDSAALAPT